MPEEAATPQPVELARQTFDAASRKDLDAVMGFFAPDAVWDMSDLGMGTFDGVAAVRGFVEDWFATWEDHQNEVQEMLYLGHGVVFSMVREDARLAGGVGRVEQQRGWVSVWAQGKAMLVAVFLDPATARDAAESLAEERG